MESIYLTFLLKGVVIVEYVRCLTLMYRRFFWTSSITYVVVYVRLFHCARAFLPPGSSVSIGLDIVSWSPCDIVVHATLQCVVLSLQG